MFFKSANKAEEFHENGGGHPRQIYIADRGAKSQRNSPLPPIRGFNTHFSNLLRGFMGPLSALALGSGNLAHPLKSGIDWKN